LVHDARPRRHDAEVLEVLLRPAQQRVALAIALVLACDIGAKGEGRAEEVHLHRVVDDQVRGHQRVDAVGVATQLLDGVAHGGEVYHRRHAGEVLQDDARGQER